MVNQDHEANLIRQKIDDWVAAAASRDAEAVARFYTRDGKFLLPNAPIAEGHAAVAAMWNNLFGLPNMRLKFGPTVVEVAASGDFAYDQGTYTLSFDGPAGRIEDRGKYVVVWKKEDDEWLAAADILNSDLPVT
jgi:uncharacterized protein (TIGR02246 family)